MNLRLDRNVMVLEEDFEEKDLNAPFLRVALPVAPIPVGLSKPADQTFDFDWEAKGTESVLKIDQNVLERPALTKPEIGRIPVYE